MFFLFNRTTLQVFVTYRTGALYVHLLWFYRHQHDNRVRFKLFVACQWWWFQWRFWFVPSVPGYTRTLSLENVHTPSNGIVRWWLFPEFGAELPLDNYTPTIILNNPVYTNSYTLHSCNIIFKNCRIPQCTEIQIALGSVFPDGVKMT